MESSHRSTASVLMRAAGLAALLPSQAAQADIVVGQVAPFSGPQAVTGKAVRTSAPFDLGGCVLDFSTRGRNGSQYVNFGIFGSNGRIVQ